jgi:hypothetical protein
MGSAFNDPALLASRRLCAARAGSCGAAGVAISQAALRRQSRCADRAGVRRAVRRSTHRLPPGPARRRRALSAGGPSRLDRPLCRYVDRGSRERAGADGGRVECALTSPYVERVERASGGGKASRRRAPALAAMRGTASSRPSRSGARPTRRRDHRPRLEPVLRHRDGSATHLNSRILRQERANPSAAIICVLGQARPAAGSPWLLATAAHERGARPARNHDSSLKFDPTDSSVPSAVGIGSGAQPPRSSRPGALPSR